jgi:hypothetical protein
MGLESDYCRGPVAAMFNRMKGFMWKPSRNFSYAVKGAKGGFVESGEPDGMVHAPFSSHFYVECKAYKGSIDFAELRDNQIDWWHKCCLETGSDTLHYVSAAVYPEHDPDGNFDLDLWAIYLIPTPEWLRVKNDLRLLHDTASLPATENQRGWAKSYNAAMQFGRYALTSYREKVQHGKKMVNELRYAIPDKHALWNDLYECHAQALRTRREVVYVGQPSYCDIGVESA